MHSCKVEQNHHSTTRDDVFLCIPPLYHTGAKMHWFGSLYVGGKAVLLKGTKPEWIIKAISERNARCCGCWCLGVRTYWMLWTEATSNLKIISWISCG